MKLMSCFYINRKDLEQKFITLEDINRHSGGLIVFSGGASGLAGKLFLSETTEHTSSAKNFINELHNIMQDNFYIEISRHGMSDEIATESFFIKMAMDKGVPLVATNDVHFFEQDMFMAQDVLMCIESGSYLATEGRKKLTSEHYLKSTEEMFELFFDVKEAAENTSWIAQRCSFMPTPAKPMLPRFDDGSGRSEESIIKEKGLVGLEERLVDEVFWYKEHEGKSKDEIRQEYIERFHFELAVIEKMGFCGYFLIVSDFVTWAKQQSIPVGPGRGSGAGSVVGWSLKITNLDPLRYSLIFERFLNPERISMPDFDIDFCQARRDEVINYVLSRYGKDKVAHIIALGKLQARAAIRDVGRVIQMPYGLVDKICKLIPNNPSYPVDLTQALEIEPQLKEMMQKEEQVSFLINTALKIEGLYRHASIHAAGIVISNRAVDEVVPLYSDPETNLAITQFNMKDSEKAGLVKFDFLGLKTLTVIQEACDNIRKYHKTIVDISKINLEDKKTFDLLCNVDVVGIFQLESAGMRDVIEKLQPDRLEDLIALVSLYRPGPIDDIPKYLSRKHGKEPIEYPHPLVIPFLESTYGIMVYQEQVLKMAQIIGGYTLASADILRRAMGKKIKKEMDMQKKIFIEGAKERGVTESTASQIFAQMEKFAGYGFNRSHAAPYALLSYQTAFLKANYRLEFYIAVLNLDIDHTDKVSSYINDAKKAGITIFPPDVNSSDCMFTEERDGIRYAFSAIKGIGVKALEYIVTERNKNGKFKDIFDFLSRTNQSGLNKKQLEGLILAGAFDSIHSNRRQLYKSMDQMLLSKKTQQQNSMQISFFGLVETNSDIILSNEQEWPTTEKLDRERDVIGFYLSTHPIDVYREVLTSYKITKSSGFSSVRGYIKIAGVILKKVEKLSKNAQKYAFLTVSDQDGSFEVTVFPDLYAKVSSTIQIGKSFLIDADVKTESENIKLMATSINEIDLLLSKQKIYLSLDNDVDLDKLHKTIESFEDGENSISFIVKKSEHKRFEIETKYKKCVSLEDRNKLANIKGVRFGS
jgi:DNA polymerase-3 subunit alpha